MSSLINCYIHSKNLFSASISSNLNILWVISRFVVRIYSKYSAMFWCCLCFLAITLAYYAQIWRNQFVSDNFTCKIISCKLIHYHFLCSWIKFKTWYFFKQIWRLYYFNLWWTIYFYVSIFCKLAISFGFNLNLKT